MRVAFPKCEWCGAPDPRVCQSCDRFTCYECLLVVLGPDGDCVHRKFEPIVESGWYVERNDHG